MRQVVMAIIGLLVVAGAIYLARQTVASKKGFEVVERARVTPVVVETVENATANIEIVTSGQLRAKNRLQLFSEVQGVFEPSGKEFKPGVWYKKGELLMRINSDEYYATLQAQKSTLYNQIIAFLPDLRLDFPESFPQWDTYVKAFDLSQPVAVLPDPVSDREKLFISGRNIYTTYYTVQNMQLKYEKYHIYAPYTGVLTEAMIQPGSLIRPGQQLGEFLDQSVFELEAQVNVEYLDLLRIGESVTLREIQGQNTYSGEVARLNGKVDQSTQTLTVFIDVRGKNLREGMYLEAALSAKEEPNAFELQRKLLVNETQVFVVRDSVLDLVHVEPVYYKEKTVYVRGLEDGTNVLSTTIPGAYTGMKVNVLNNSVNQQPTL